MIRVTIQGEIVPVEQIEAICEAVGASVEVLRGIGIARPTVREIMGDVSFETGISVADIVGPYRGRDIHRARCAVSYVARHSTGQALTTVGRAMGDRDHATILQQLVRADEMRDGRDPAFKRLTDRLTKHYAEARS